MDGRRDRQSRRESLESRVQGKLASAARRGVGAALQQVRGEGMTQGMGTNGLRQTGPANRHLDGVVDDVGVNVMATDDTGTRVHREIPGGEDILPALFLGGMRRLPSQRMGEGDLAMPRARSC